MLIFIGVTSRRRSRLYFILCSFWNCSGYTGCPKNFEILELWNVISNVLRGQILSKLFSKSIVILCLFLLAWLHVEEVDYIFFVQFWNCSGYTGCPKSSFLYFLSLYFSTIELVKQIIETEVVSFNLIYYFHTCCAIFWLEYSICVLPRQRCPCASIFPSQIFVVFYSPNCSNSFLVFCEYHER